MKTPSICIMAGKPRGALHTGVWIPAFAGMTGGRSESDEVGVAVPTLRLPGFGFPPARE